MRCLLVALVAAAPPFAERREPERGGNATYLLSDGVAMPVFGLGVYLAKPGPEAYDACLEALKLGYRLIDTAHIYKNEEDVGRAIKDSGVARKDLFIVTKLWDSEHGYDKTRAAFLRSLANLGLEYLDLYLMHSPNTGKLVESYDAMLDLKDEGLLRSAGVSNFDVRHLEALRTHGRPMPSVNQFEMHPLIYQKRYGLLEYCQKHRVLVQAYGSIFFGKPERLAEAPVADAAAAHKKSAAQVLLRWGLQMGFQLIPKSVNADRIAANMQIFDFELSESEVARLSAMEGDLGAYWDPITNAEVDVGDTSRRTPKATGEL
jgi:diketogulonate reductase-like aldo/keto reductase